MADAPRVEPAQSAPPATVSPHLTVPVGQRPNVWKFQAKDSQGRLLEPSPGHPFYIVRGPDSRAELVKAAHILLGNARLEAIRAGQDDPGYVLVEDSIQPQGRSDQAEDVGQWKPAGAVPVEVGVGLLEPKDE